MLDVYTGHYREERHGNRAELAHINRNKLDNRRSNLRIVSQLANCHNTNSKGYTFHKKSNSFRAYLNFNGKHYISKNLANKEEAIRVRDMYISKYCSLK